ncbi:5047_t:CDS:2 [Paraglomus brasilianum]|uniref:5047_t:CDS:1 n=1 Tax=Paraglomus brasilianum TaxID=144538 RepID=A0A9N9BH41_9GLOM|nr:5047_t:CDS:2 [Paraglomus brasilianum]
MNKSLEDRQPGASLTAPTSSPSKDQQEFLYPNHMRAADLLRLLGGERSWSESEIQIDLNVLELNRLRTVRDLRSLSEKSWEKIQLLPLVKDLLTDAIRSCEQSAGSQEIQIKVRYTERTITTPIVRKMTIARNITLEHFKLKLATNYNFSVDKELEYSYCDEDGDRVILSYDEELTQTLADKTYLVLDVKATGVDYTFCYPEIPRKYDTQVCKVLIPSQYLTLENSSNGPVWGTDIYTTDSAFLKALVHSGLIEVNNTPPSYDVLVTVQYLPGRVGYSGSKRHGISSRSWGKYESSMTFKAIEKIPYVEKA